MSLTPEIVRELLHYDPDTGVFTWSQREERWFRSGRACRAWNARFCGKRAGIVWTNSRGYKRRQIKLFKRSHLEHRIAWMWMTGSMPPDEIDHENQDATDNRWINLRVATHAENGRNQPRQVTNTSGVTGVSWHKVTRKWIAEGRHEGDRKHLGLFDEIDEAAMAVLEFRADHGFSPRHGIDLAPYHKVMA